MAKSKKRSINDKFLIYCFYVIIIYMKNSTLKQLTLKRKDGKLVDAEFYANVDSELVEVLDIKKLHFAGMPVKDIKKSDIHDVVLRGGNKLYFQNKYSRIVAGLSKRHLNKIISTIFTRDIKSRHAYLKKELISNVDEIFYAAIPILKHPELKKEVLFDCQIIHRFAVPLRVGELVFLAMITVKERVDFKNLEIDEFSIYDLYSEIFPTNKKSSDSSSMVSAGITPVTSHSHYRMINLSITDLCEFVKCSITKIQ